MAQDPWLLFDRGVSVEVRSAPTESFKGFAELSGGQKALVSAAFSVGLQVSFTSTLGQPALPRSSLPFLPHFLLSRCGTDATMPQSVFPCPVLFCDELDAALDWKRAKVLAAVLSVREPTFSDFFFLSPAGRSAVLPRGSAASMALTRCRPLACSFLSLFCVPPHSACPRRGPLETEVDLYR